MRGWTFQAPPTSPRWYWRSPWRHYPANPRDIILPFGPVQAVTSVTLYDETGSAHLLAPSDYDADIISEPATLKVRNLQGVSLRWTNPLAVEFVCGYGDSGTTVPESIRQAIMTVAEYLHLDGAVAAIKQFVEDTGTALGNSQIGQSLKTVAGEVKKWGGIIADTALNTGSDIAESVADGFGKAQGYVSGKLGAVKSLFSGGISAPQIDVPSVPELPVMGADTPAQASAFATA